MTISASHYNQVPDYCFQGAKTILDIGCLSGLNALLSRHRTHFLAAEARGDYLGLDINPPAKTYLSPIETGDLRQLKMGRTFDLVLVLHVLEHVPIDEWMRTIYRLMCHVAPGGYLVIGTPHNEDPEHPADADHKVHRITVHMLRQFLPATAIVRRVRRRYVHYREPQESHLMALPRFFYRILTRHHHRFRLLGNFELIAIWHRPLGSPSR